MSLDAHFVSQFRRIQALCFPIILFAVSGEISAQTVSGGHKEEIDKRICQLRNDATTRRLTDGISGIDEICTKKTPGKGDDPKETPKGLAEAYAQDVRSDPTNTPQLRLKLIRKLSTYAKTFPP